MKDIHSFLCSPAESTRRQGFPDVQQRLNHAPASFDVSLKYRNHSVTTIIAQGLPVSLTLGLLAFGFSLGVGLPLFLLFAEWRALRTDDPVWRSLARRWSKAFGILFAVGAVLTWAVNVTTSGVNLHTIGVILMIVGAIGLLVSLFVWGPWGLYGDRGDRTIIRDREVVDRDMDHHHHRTIT